MSTRNHECNNPETENPTWTTWQEALRVVFYRPYLKKTSATALIVGSLLFAINHLDIVLSGKGTPIVWVKGGLTYLVPFCVSNVGVLLASRRV